MRTDLINVLTEPRNALVKQYECLFEMENSKLSFTDDALRAIAQEALERGTGARGLRSIIERVMMDIMFELPDQEPGHTYEVNEAVIQGREAVHQIPQTKSA